MAKILFTPGNNLCSGLQLPILLSVCGKIILVSVNLTKLNLTELNFAHYNDAEVKKYNPCQKSNKDLII